jgi:indolepyruvate ferredoxin oxidoreductase
MLARKDPATGVPRKMSFGPWMMKAFRVLAKLKPLRGTPLDVFGYSHERRTERQLIREFERRIEEIVSKLTPDNHATAIGLAGIPQKIRGFGHIKERNLKAARAEEADLLAKFRAEPRPLPVAAE